MYGAPMGALTKCPWCAEEILAEAKKCKHCGEFMSDPPATAVVSPPGSSTAKPVWRLGSFYWSCIAHSRIECPKCKNLIVPPKQPGQKGDLYPTATRPAEPYKGTAGHREKLSQVGDRSSGTLSCPKCGGTSFTAKRSAKGKLIGFTTLGVGGLVAPKSQVKCVACGEMFKRG